MQENLTSAKVWTDGDGNMRLNLWFDDYTVGVTFWEQEPVDVVIHNLRELASIIEIDLLDTRGRTLRAADQRQDTNKSDSAIKKTCPSCLGQGRTSIGHFRLKCGLCNGTGQVTVESV